MPINPLVQHVTIPLSGFVTGDIGLIRAEKIAILFPVMTSGQAFLQGNFDTTSAGFVRVGQADGSADFFMATGIGSNGFVVSDVLVAMSHARVEMGVAQSAVRSITIIAR